MFDCVKTLRELSEADYAAYGIDGADSAASVALRELKKHAPNACVDDFGSVRGCVGNSAEKSGRKLIIDAHIDEVAMLVTHITDEGFIKAGFAGGVDARTLPARAATVHGTRPLRGVVTTLPPHAKKDKDTAISEDEVYIDAGYSADTISQLREVVRPGDIVTLRGNFTELHGGNVSGKALDNRASVCAVLWALDMAEQHGGVKREVEILFSAREEIKQDGAANAAWRVVQAARDAGEATPEAVVVDVTYAVSPDVSQYEGGKLGGGVMLGIAPALDRGMFLRVTKVAEEKGIPHNTEAMPSRTGTNADTIQTLAGGVKTALLSIPQRYMHQPIEVVNIGDIENTAKLLCEIMTNEEVFS